jgi:predicted phosphodiesterase
MRVGIIADIHEDVVALKDAFNILEHSNCEQVFCLGDIIGYKVTAYHYLDTRNAHECIAMIRANCSSVVIGNNDLYQIRKLPSNKTAFDFPENWYELDFYQRKMLAKENVFLYEDVQLPSLITREDRSYLETLPETCIVEYDNLRMMLSHFAFPDLLGVRTYFPKTALEFQEHLSFIESNGCTLGFSGHMHFEGVSICNRQTLKRNDFVKCPLTDPIQWIYGPCVARGRFHNGVMILDTQTREIEAIPLTKALWINGTLKLNAMMLKTL